jgi:AAA domain
MAEELGPFEKDVSSWKRALRFASDKPATYVDAVHNIVGMIAQGLPRALAVDTLTDMAMANDLENVSELHDCMIIELDRLDRALEPDVSINGGHAPIKQPTQLAVECPFPIVGSKIMRRPWLIPGLLLRRQVTVLVAPPGSGKSLLTMQIGIACAAAKTWHGWRPRARLRVLFINVEEDYDEMRRRLVCAAKVMEIEQEELTGVYVAKTNDIVVAKADSRTKSVVATPMLNQIGATISALSIDIVVVDPFAETFIGDENSNSELKWAGVLWRDVARKTNSSILLVHHAKKYAQDMAGDPDAGRGGGSLIGIARIVATLFTMTEAEALTYKLKPEDRVRYIRFDDAKANLNLIKAGARWFYKETVSLENADDGEPADEVGVLIPWSSPDPFETMGIPVANQILDELDVGVRDPETNEPIGEPYSERKSTRWAGAVIQEHLQCDVDQAKSIIRKWIDNGVLTVKQQKTKRSKGQMRDCVIVNTAARPGMVTASTLI